MEIKMVNIDQIKADKNKTTDSPGPADVRSETRKAVAVAASLSKENQIATWEGLSAKPATQITRDQCNPMIDLFAVRKSSDDKSILDDLDLASQLLERHCGEIGFALANSIWKFIGKSRDRRRAD